MHRDKCIVCHSGGIMHKTYKNRFCDCKMKFHKTCFVSHYNHKGSYTKCLTNSHHFTQENKVKIHEFINAEVYWIYFMVILICNSALVSGLFVLYLNIDSFYYLSLVCITSVYSYYLCPLISDYIFILRGNYPVKYLRENNSRIFSRFGEYLGLCKKGKVNFINYEIIVGMIFYITSIIIGSLYVSKSSNNDNNGTNKNSKYDQISLILSSLIFLTIFANKIYTFTVIPPTIVENFRLEVRN